MKAFIAGCLLITSISSCVVIVRKYPTQKPFVYDTKIRLSGNFTKAEKTNLEDALKGQLDDSLRARRRDNLLWETLKHPPVYDSTNSDKSLIFMKSLLGSLGYFDDSISYTDTVIPHGKEQLRTHVVFNVAPRRLWRLDTIVYNMRDPILQHLADSTKKAAQIKKGDAFATAPISAEIDRLTELFRNNGYLRFSRDELIGVWDTLDVSLLQPTLDPFEQLRILEQLRQRKQSPTAKLEFRLRPIDSSKLTRYYNGNVTIYPDYSIDVDTVNLPKRVDVDSIHHVTVIQWRNRFKPKIFPPNIYLPHDSLYRLRRYIRTVNRLNLLGTWRLVNIDQIPRKDNDTVDFVARLTPAKKFSFTTTVEGSINQSATSGTLFGVGLNFGLQNRNFARAANFDAWNARYGVEFGGSGTHSFIQTQTISLARNITFPRAIVLDKILPDRRKDNFRTVLGGNVGTTARRYLYNQFTFNTSWGYEFQLRNMLLTVKPLNIEYSLLNKKDSLDSLIKYNPSLRNIFTDGLVFSVVGNLILNWSKKNTVTVFRGNLEFAPSILAPFHSPFLDTEVYRFIKVDVEVARLIRFTKTSIALRGFLGVGIADPFNTTVNPEKRNALPFFKQYFSGGPNSMRAWALRRLGPGALVKNFTGDDGTPDRYGDVQLEFNAEYRFPLGRPLGIKLQGAVFTDMGNIWLLKKEAGPSEAVFHFDNFQFLKDFAIGAGAGLRIDFGFFVIRLDYSYKVKDPTPSEDNATLQNQWFAYQLFKGAQFQLGIGYPFIF